MKKHQILSAILLTCIFATTGMSSSQASSTPQIPRTVSPAGLPKVTTPLPPWKFENNQANSLDGYVVASAGDVNHDGYDDVIIGDREFDGGATDSGRAYLFYGSATGPSTSPSMIFDPSNPEYSGFFGSSAGYAGDVNCDGIDDLYIGEENYDYNYPDEGAVFVYYGSNTGVSATPNWMARGNSTYAHFGTAAGAAGDVNGDGCGDIIVGAIRYDYVEVNHAFVWYGSPSGLGPSGIALGSGANPDWYAQDATGESWDYSHGAGPYFGSSVGSAGDVNGDGFDDVIVGAQNTPGYPSNRGAAYVWYGSASGLGDPGTIDNADWKVNCSVDSCKLGESVGSAGDINGDGYDDVIIGAPYYSYNASNQGAAFVWYGGPGGLGDNGTQADADWIAVPNQVSTLLGWSVGSAGDINGDGIDDIIVGAYAYDAPPALTNAGAVFVWKGSRSGLGAMGTPDNAFKAYYGDQANCYLGNSVAGAGDVNKDRADDLIFGAFYYTDPEAKEGAIWLALSENEEKSLYLPLILK